MSDAELRERRAEVVLDVLRPVMKKHGLSLNHGADYLWSDITDNLLPAVDALVRDEIRRRDEEWRTALRDRRLKALEVDHG